jgi:CRISP-associated protein Cas1
LRRGKEFLADACRGRITSRSCAGSKGWFEVFGCLLKGPREFPGRLRRPPTDPVNAWLSLGYTWLLNRMLAQLQAAGLNVQVGALHDYRAGRPLLACDLIEPLRVPVFDRWLQKLCNCDMLAAGDFERGADQGVLLVRDVFPRVLGWWEKNWHAGQVAGKLDQRVRRFCRRVRELAGD